MIQFDRVHVAFSDQILFEDVSFTIQKGERCGLVGRNGSGKSTILRLIDGEMEPDKGTISVPKNYKVGYLQQHIRFTESTILKEVSKGLQNDQIYKAEKILFGLGFSEEDLELPPTKFSGGFYLRLHLAKVLTLDPDCLLLDEPTNYLDILSIRWLMQFLNKWPKEFILISHDRDFMDQITTHTMGIHRQKVRKMKGTSIDFFKQILLEEEVHEKTRLKLEKKKAEVERFVERFGAKATKAAQAKSKKKMLMREPVLEKLNQLSALSFAFQEAPFPGIKMLEASNLGFSFSEKPLIHDFSCEIEKGERCAIIGKNGRGKSTLLRLIAKDLDSKEGMIKFSDNIRIGYFGQTHVERLNSRNTIEEEISLANPKLAFQEIKAIAGLMMFGGSLSEKKVGVLSGGEKSRVLLGTIVAKPCNLLLLDEPTHHLDIESIEALIDALEDFSGAIVIVTHSELILRRLGLDKIIICGEEKQTLFLGDYDEFLKKIGWEEEKKNIQPKKSTFNIRKEKADWVGKRSAALKPIEKRVQESEKKLAQLEEEQKKDQSAIEKGEVSTEILQSFGFRKKEIEQLEMQLYELYEIYEKKKGEFEKENPNASFI